MPATASASRSLPHKSLPSARGMAAVTGLYCGPVSRSSQPDVMCHVLAHHKLRLGRACASCQKLPRCQASTRVILLVCLARPFFPSAPTPAPVVLVLRLNQQRLITSLGPRGVSANSENCLCGLLAVVIAIIILIINYGYTHY